MYTYVDRADSVFEIQKRLPDSITSYVTRALVISPSTGLHIPDNTQVGLTDMTSYIYTMVGLIDYLYLYLCRSYRQPNLYTGRSYRQPILIPL